MQHLQPRPLVGCPALRRLSPTALTTTTTPAKPLSASRAATTKPRLAVITAFVTAIVKTITVAAITRALTPLVGVHAVCGARLVEPPHEAVALRLER